MRTVHKFSLVPTIVGLFLYVGVVYGKAGTSEEIITKCGSSIGKSYYINPDKGWIDDGIKNGKLTFKKTKDGDFDIVIVDSAGTFTAREDGAKVSVVKQDGGYITLLAVYPLKVVEIFQLLLDTNGKGQLIWSSIKNIDEQNNFIRGSMFVAECNK